MSEKNNSSKGVYILRDESYLCKISPEIRKSAKKIIIRRESVASGWMRQSRNTVRMILIITGIMQVLLCSALTFIR